MKALISIVAFNRIDLTKRCVESVLESVRHGSKLEVRLRLTDNGSSDGVGGYFEQVAATVPGVTVVHNDENKGFIPPSNAAFDEAKERQMDLLILLNNDAAVPLGWLDRMVAEIERHPAAALVGYQGTCCELQDNFHGAFGSRLEYIEGSCIAISVPKVAKHFSELFDPNLQFAYGEDSDLSLRMRRLGYTIHRAAFTIDHQRGSTTQIVPEAKKFQELNHVYLRRKWAHYLKVRKFGYRIGIRRWHAHGDVLLTTPIIRGVWQQNPLSEIVFETSCENVLRRNPYLSLVGKQIQRFADDFWIDLDNSYENMPLRHIVTSYHRVAGLEGPVNNWTEMYWDPRCGPAFPEGKWIAVHTGPSWHSKLWPMDRFNIVTQRLIAAGYKIVLVGSERMDGHVQSDMDLRGRTSIEELASVLSRCKVVIGIDSFIVHCAQAVGTPVVGLFGITSPRFILTDGSPAIGVCSSPTHPDTGRRHHETLSHHAFTDDSAIKTITVDQVMEAVNKLLA